MRGWGRTEGGTCREGKERGGERMGEREGGTCREGK